MSRFFVLPTEEVGPGGDIVFRRHPGMDGWYLVEVGGQRLGTVGQHRRGHWWGQSNAKESEFFGVKGMEGFATRYDAATFVIKTHGYWMRNERESIRMHEGSVGRLRLRIARRLEEAEDDVPWYSNT
jgi:hypothetical protein